LLHPPHHCRRIQSPKKSTDAKKCPYTGANRGLGLELTKQLVQLGYFVWMGVRNEEAAEAARATLSSPSSAGIIILDLQDSSTFSNAYDKILSAHGQLDILINNAGVMLEDDLSKNSAASITEQQLKTTFDINFFGTVLLTNKLLPLLLKSKTPRIVNVSTNMGSQSLQAAIPELPKTFAYNASKAALNAYTIHLSALLQDTPVKVNAVHPGWVKTDMGGPHAPLTIEEGVKTILAMALLNEQGFSGRFVHNGEEVAW
jgi:NAD(P)-dependent dehydrogenase (short-subunit alcohol dehydrogenase family)